MNSKMIIGLVLAVVVLGGAALLLSSPKGGAPLVEEVKEETQKGSGVLSDLLMRAGSWKCTAATYFEEAPSSGTIYVADGKVRGDFVATPEEGGGAQVQSSMIQADGYVYLWSDTMPQGMKMKVPSSTDPAVSEATPVDYSAKVDYDCDPWIPDASKFVPPETISFMELGEIVAPEGMPKVPSY